MQFSTIVTAAIFGTIAAAAPTYEEALQIRSLVIRQTSIYSVLPPHTLSNVIQRALLSPPHSTL